TCERLIVKARVLGEQIRKVCFSSPLLLPTRRAGLSRNRNEGEIIMLTNILGRKTASKPPSNASTATSSTLPTSSRPRRTGTRTGGRLLPMLLPVRLLPPPGRQPPRLRLVVVVVGMVREWMD